MQEFVPSAVVHPKHPFDGSAFSLEEDLVEAFQTCPSSLNMSLPQPARSSRSALRCSETSCRIRKMVLVV